MVTNQNLLSEFFSISKLDPLQLRIRFLDVSNVSFCYYLSYIMFEIKGISCKISKCGSCLALLNNC